MVDTRTLGTQKGAPSFQSPEQLTAMDVGTNADIYAFGGVTVELVGEKPVWEGLHPYQIITKVVTMDGNRTLATWIPDCNETTVLGSL